MTKQSVQARSLDVSRARLVVLYVSLIALAAKLAIASTTYGTEDIHTWMGFALGVRQRGPVGVYSIDFPTLNGTLYNHPPLMGFFLQLLNLLSDWGVPLRFSFRAITSLCDVASAFLLLEMLRRRISLARATIASVAVAASPQLLLISGYHGNTEPIFAMLVLAAMYLTFDRDRALSGGVMLALAVGIKLVPVVVLPTFCVYVLRHRRDLAARLAAGLLGTLAITWGWALLHESTRVRQNVLGYKGIPDRPWGPVHLAAALGWHNVVGFLITPGSTLVVLACGLVPALLAWRRSSSAAPAVALSLLAFLAFSPAFGTHYLAWAVAAAYILDEPSAHLFNVLGGLLMFEVYDRWNGGLPWTDIAYGRMFVPVEVAMAAMLWWVVILVMARGLTSGFSRPSLLGHSAETVVAADRESHTATTVKTASSASLGRGR